MSFLTVWFGAVASESSSALVDGDVRAPVANHCSRATRSYVCVRVPVLHQQDGVFHNFTHNRTHQIFRQFPDPKPFDLRSMFSELLFENGLVLRDVIQNFFGLELLRLRRGVRGSQYGKARHLGHAEANKVSGVEVG